MVSKVRITQGTIPPAAIRTYNNQQMIVWSSLFTYLCAPLSRTYIVCIRSWLRLRTYVLRCSVPTSYVFVLAYDCVPKCICLSFALFWFCSTNNEWKKWASDWKEIPFSHNIVIFALPWDKKSWPTQLVYYQLSLESFGCIVFLLLVFSTLLVFLLAEPSKMSFYYPTSHRRLRR